MPQNPVATYAPPLSTGVNVQNPTAYKGNIDAMAAAFARIADNFAPHANSTPDMRVYLDPGHIFTGTGLTEIGADTLGTVTNASTSVAITGSVVGISGTMLVSGPGIPANTTATISGTTVTLSQAASGLASSPQTNAPLRFMQRTAAITAPVSNSRIDRIVADRITGAVSVITGTPGTSPAVPALTTGVIPVAQILITSATTAITNSMITDERDLNGLGYPGTNQVTIASATTTDLGTTKSDNVLISGTTTITAFGSSAGTDSPLYFVKFSGSLLLTHNASSLILPGGASITTQANDNATFLYLGSGNWLCVDYQRANGQAVSTYATETTLASASTTDLGSSNGNLINVTGTTTITSFGSSANVANPIYKTRFTGAVLLTYNATSLILPGSANYTTAAGDVFEWKYEGSGNWRCIGVSLANGKPIGGGGMITIKKQQFLTAGTFTYTPSAGTLYAWFRMVGSGGSGSGGNGAGSGSGGGGGGAGEYGEVTLSAATIGASLTVVIGAGVAGGTTTNNGNDGNTSSLGTAGAQMSCAGGKKGLNVGTGGLGGTSAGAGDVKIPGQPGASIQASTNSGGAGGSSPLGPGGLAPGPASNSAGNAGLGNGSGGSSANGSGTGGASPAGGMLVMEWCSS